MLRCRTFFSQIPVFSPRAQGMVRLAAPRFSCAAHFFVRRRRKKMRGSFFNVGAKHILGMFRRRRNCFWTCCWVADEFCFRVFFAAGEKMFGFVFVLISSQMLCLGLVSSFFFGIECFTSFDNSIETVAVFRCPRTFQANQARDLWHVAPIQAPHSC